ncbi:MAG: homocysteine S-methyltransferase family protein, partial [bacterium]
YLEYISCPPILKSTKVRISRMNLNFGIAAIEWFNLGARLLGGCCRTSPSQIADMRKALMSRKLLTKL